MACKSGGRGTERGSSLDLVLALGGPSLLISQFGSRRRLATELVFRLSQLQYSSHSKGWRSRSRHSISGRHRWSCWISNCATSNVQVQREGIVTNSTELLGDGELDQFQAKRVRRERVVVTAWFFSLFLAGRSPAGYSGLSPAPRRVLPMLTRV